MTKKWIAINVALLLGLGLLGWRLYVSINRFSDENDLTKLARVQSAKKKGATDAALPSLQTPRKYSDAEFAVIPAQNLFVESRKPEDKAADTPPPPETRVLEIKPILVGVTLSGTQRLAMINDPANTAAGPRHSQTMRLGDNYRGFVVTDITENSMVLEYGSSREVIPLYDTSKPPQGGKTPILATRIVNFGGGAGGSGGAVAVASAAAPGGVRSPVNTNPNPGAGGARPNQPAANTNQQRGITQTGQQGAVQVPMQQGATWNQTIDPRTGTVIINSPFGAFPAQQTVPNQQPPIKK